MAAGRRAFPELPPFVKGMGAEIMIGLMRDAINILRDAALPELMRVSASITIDKRHSTLLVDTTAAARTITLPKGMGDGFAVLIVDSGNAAANNITVSGGGGATVEGAASVAINTNRGYRRFMYDAEVGDWRRVG